ncbi:MAG: hypothetical protein RSG57_05905, partial [Christensenellaceae bacterium]
MKIYDAYKINYFAGYLNLIVGYYGDFSGGLDKWRSGLGEYVQTSNAYIDDDFSFTTYCEYLKELCDVLRFFEFDHYGDLSLGELELLLEDAPRQRNLQLVGVREQHIAKAKLRNENKVENYFNFGDFSEKKFSAFTESCTTKHKKGGNISIDDAIRLAQKAPKRMYIVTLSISGKVVFAGKTGNLLTYLGKYSQKYHADSASFEAVDEDYTNDVLLATMIFFDLPLDTVRITTANRKYTTLKQACFAYKRSEDIPRKVVQNAIHIHKLRPIELPTGDIVYDKIALEKALR